MQTILLIRHAKAKDREKWIGEDDALRPLTGAGHRQAKAIAMRWASEGFTAIRSSPALRCVHTVEPLAEATGVDLTIDNDLFEGSAIELPDDVEKGVIAICAHGDNIPALLGALGISCPECRKGSIWALHRNANGEIVRADYIPPPEV